MKKTGKVTENKSRKMIDDTYIQDFEQEIAVSGNDKNRKNLASEYEGQFNKNMESDKLSLLKTKVLKKVSTGVIQRKKKIGENFNEKDEVMLKESKKYEKAKLSSKTVILKDGRSGSLSEGKTYSVKRQKSFLKGEKTGQLNENETLVNGRKRDKDVCDVTGNRKVVRDFETESFDGKNSDESSSVTDKKNEKFKTKTISAQEVDVKSKTKNISAQEADVKIGHNVSLTDFENKSLKMTVEGNGNVSRTENDSVKFVQNDLHNSSRHSHEFTTERHKNMETSIENIKNQNGHGDAEEWSEFSQGHWTYELDYKPSEDIFSLTNNSKNVPQCNPDVKLWLRRLGLLEEEKYFKIFSENEIDMDELSELTYEQLKEMGIVAIGALNKLLRGIAELKLDLKKQKLKGDDPVSSPKSSDSKDVRSFESEHRSPSPVHEQNSLASHINFDFTTKRTSRDDSVDGYSQNIFSDHKFSFVEPNYRYTPGERRVRDTGVDEVIKGDICDETRDQNKRGDNDRTSQLCSSDDNVRSGLPKHKQTDERSYVELKGINDNPSSNVVNSREKCEESDSKTTKKNTPVVRERSLSRQNSAKSRKEDLLNKQSSRVSSAKTTSRESRKTQSAKSKQKKNDKNANKSVTKLTRSRSSDRKIQSETGNYTPFFLISKQSMFGCTGINLSVHHTFFRQSSFTFFQNTVYQILYRNYQWGTFSYSSAMRFLGIMTLGILL